MERRDAGRWQDEEQNTGRQTNASARKGYAVAGIQSGAIDLIDTARLANILVLGQKAPHLTETPLTGKPDARNSPVRFGGRGEVIPHLYPYLAKRRMPEAGSLFQNPVEARAAVHGIRIFDQESTVG